MRPEHTRIPACVLHLQSPDSRCYECSPQSRYRSSSDYCTAACMYERDGTREIVGRENKRQAISACTSQGSVMVHTSPHATDRGEPEFADNLCCLFLLLCSLLFVFSFWAGRVRRRVSGGLFPIALLLPGRVLCRRPILLLVHVHSLCALSPLRPRLTAQKLTKSLPKR